MAFRYVMWSMEMGRVTDADAILPYRMKGKGLEMDPSRHSISISASCNMILLWLEGSILAIVTCWSLRLCLLRFGFCFFLPLITCKNTLFYQKENKQRRQYCLITWMLDNTLAGQGSVPTFISHLFVPQLPPS